MLYHQAHSQEATGDIPDLNDRRAVVCCPGIAHAK